MARYFSQTPSPDSTGSSASSSSSINAQSRVIAYNYSKHKKNFPPSVNNRNANGNSQCSLQEEVNKLPINLVKEQLLQKIQENKSIILIGQTGCGKTTQLPKLVYHHFNNSLLTKGMIGITQPRRVAAISISKRVAQEMNTELGQLVGYSIRFEDHTSLRTKIKFMTDGILLREAITDRLLSKYSVIVLDEAHERTVQTDVLFGIVKKAQRLRGCKRSLKNGNIENATPLPPLKLIIMSATMNVDNFSAYFNNAPVLVVQGRTFPISTFHPESFQEDYIASALTTVYQIHQDEDELEDAKIGGDILVFCTGQEEIEFMVKTTKDLLPQLNEFKTASGLAKTLKPLPLYAALPMEVQKSIFTRTSGVFRRVIFATNIAETSITIPNIRFVVDTGKFKSRVYSPLSGLEVMRVERISRAQALQRAGRAGRLAPGKCYRMFTQQEFEEMSPFAVPEIQKCNLTNVVLQLVAIGIRDVEHFDFIDAPSADNLRTSLDQLLSMNAVELAPKVNGSGESNGVSSKSYYTLTEIGRKMVLFPVDPRYAGLIIASKQYRCTDEVLIIIAMLSIDSVYSVPTDKRELALKMHKKFHSSEGDLIKLLNVFRRFKECKESAAWCHDHYLKITQLRMATKIRHQLMELCQRASIPVITSNRTEVVRRCLATGMGVGIGLGANVAVLQRDGGYRVLTLNMNKKSKQLKKAASEWSFKSVHIHPSSCLFQAGNKPECLLFAELVLTTKAYMRNVCLASQAWFTTNQETSSSTAQWVVKRMSLNTI